MLRRKCREIVIISTMGNKSCRSQRPITQLFSNLFHAFRTGFLLDFPARWLRIAFRAEAEA